MVKLYGKRRSRIHAKILVRIARLAAKKQSNVVHVRVNVKIVKLIVRLIFNLVVKHVLTAKVDVKKAKAVLHRLNIK